MKSTFEDRRPYNSGSGYMIPNESLSILRTLTLKAAPKSAASICSAGEVPLTVLLPSCERVVAVDHSYKSLGWAMVKALMLEAYTGAEIKQMFLELTHESLFKMLDELQAHLPNKLKEHFLINFYNENQAVKPGEKRIPRPAYEKRAWTFDQFCYRNLRKLWQTIPVELLDAAREKLECIRFIHADIRDLNDYGPYDLVYASNCMEHRGHDGSGPDDKTFHKLLGKHGHLIHTGTFKNYMQTPITKWQKVEVTDYRHDPVFGGAWKYSLHEKQTPTIQSLAMDAITIWYRIDNYGCYVDKAGKRLPLKCQPRTTNSAT